jgi:hypothetical protein
MESPGAQQTRKIGDPYFEVLQAKYGPGPPEPAGPRHQQLQAAGRTEPSAAGPELPYHGHVRHEDHRPSQGIQLWALGAGPPIPPGPGPIHPLIGQPVVAVGHGGVLPPAGVTQMHLGAAGQLHQKHPWSQKAIETLQLGVGGLRSLHPAQVQP